MKKNAFTLSCNTHSSAPSTEPSQRTFGPKPCHVRAFTLAEVLLTLAIIGVVAALTIPAVITKVTKDQYVTGLKKAYNTMKAVEREAIQEHGPMENWTWSPEGGGSDPTADFEKYFLPHFDVLKNCGATSEEGCFAVGNTHLNGGTWADFNHDQYYKIVTSDGMSWTYYKYGGINPLWLQGWFLVDVNGLKGPNRKGRDIFGFEVYPSSLGIKPQGSYAYNGTPISTTEVNSSCNTSSNGNDCAAKVLSEGAMNY